MYSYEELLNVIAQLRGEHGCPWDKAQTHESLIPCLRNECEEVVQAIEQHDEENLGIQRFYIQHKGQENDADPCCSIEITHIHATGLQVQAEKKRRHDFRDT